MESNAQFIFIFVVNLSAFTAATQDLVREVMHAHDKYVVAFGYFDTDDFRDAKLLAKSHTQYKKRKKSVYVVTINFY